MDREYLLDDFDLLPPLESQREEKPFRNDSSERLTSIMECAFLQHCDKDRTTLPEPHWYPMVSILAREPGGPALIHSLSKGYPKYSPVETDNKILHAINDSGPMTCRKIKELYDCGRNCGVKSPASLAFKTNKDEPEIKKEHHFNLIQANEMMASPESKTNWLWEGILPMDGASLLVAKPKVGKTTFATNLAVAVVKGEPFLGRKAEQATVVYLALEERRRSLEATLTHLGIKDEPLFFHFGPAPAEAVREVEPLIRETGARLLVIDILQKFCRVKDLNDYSQVTRALEPLMAAARALNCHILLVHHAGKRDRDDGDDILGSTGLLGGVDTSIHIKKRERRRTFFTIQRYGDDVPETVIELKTDGSLEATGSREEVEVDETMPLILEAIGGGPLTEKEVGEQVERNRNLISKALRKLVEKGGIKREGSGKRGDPFRYSLLLYSDTIEYSNRESISGDNLLKSKENNSIDDFPKNNISIEPKKEGKDSSKGGLYEVMDDGQLTY